MGKIVEKTLSAAQGGISPMMGRIERMVAGMCPEGVKWVPLCEVVTHIRTGLNPRVHFKLNTPDADGFYITVRELSGFDITPCDKTDRINSQAVTRIQERSQIKIGDVLFSGTGTIGRTALVTKDPTNWNVKEGVYILTPIKKLLNSRFLIHLLHSKSVVEDLDNLANGSTVRSIAMKDLKDLPIPLPPLPIQEAIADILDKFDRLSAELQARKQQYEYYRNQLLTRFAPDQQVTEYSLGELAPVQRGKRLTKSQLSQEGPFKVFHGGIDPIGYYNENNREPRTVMIINVGASAGTVGFCCESFWSSDGCFCLKHSSKIDSKYLYYFLQAKEYILKSKVRHAGIPTLDNKDVDSLKIFDLYG